MHNNQDVLGYLLNCLVRETLGYKINLVLVNKRGTVRLSYFTNRTATDLLQHGSSDWGFILNLIVCLVL